MKPADAHVYIKDRFLHTDKHRKRVLEAFDQEACHQQKTNLNVSPISPAQEFPIPNT